MLSTLLASAGMQQYATPLVSNLFRVASSAAPLVQAAYSLCCRDAVPAPQHIASPSHAYTYASVVKYTSPLPWLTVVETSKLPWSTAGRSLASRSSDLHHLPASARPLLTTTAAACAKYGATGNKSSDGETPAKQPRVDVQASKELLTREQLYSYLYSTQEKEKKRVYGLEATLEYGEEQNIGKFVYKFDHHQWQAIAIASSRVQVIAGPGAGKTAVVLARILVLLACGVRPEEIVAVAFTSTAAKELKERCSQWVGSSVAAALKPCTIHELCRGLLRRYGNRLDIGVDFQKGSRVSATNRERKELLMKIMVNRGLMRDKAAKTVVDNLEKLEKASREEKTSFYRQAKVYYDYISHLKNFEEHIEGLSGQELVRRHYVEKKDKPTAQQLATVYDAYQEAMKEKGQIDYDDELHHCLSLIRGHPEVLATVHQTWKHILVDETQDLNKCQHALFRAFTGPKTSLYLVGDPDQNIYGFRGAAAADWEETFRLLGGDGQKVHLVNNYRSLPGVVVAAEELRRLSRQVCGDLGEELQERKSVRQVPSDGVISDYIFDFQVELMPCRDVTEEFDKIIETLERWKRAGYQWRDMALLSHSVKEHVNTNIGSLVHQLRTKHGIPVFKVESADDKEEQRWLQEDEEDKDEQQTDSPDDHQGYKQQKLQPAEAAIATNSHVTAADDAVQLMTLHLAKGKEFPCVAMVFTKEVYYYTSQKEKAQKSKTSAMEARRIVNELRQKYNEVYVGMSRAMNHLFISWHKDERKEKPQEKKQKSKEQQKDHKPHKELPTKMLAQQLLQPAQGQNIDRKKQGICLYQIV